MRRYWTDALFVTIAMMAVAPAAAATSAVTPVPIVPSGITAWSMFTGADWIVKSVILLLAVASVVTWAICIGRFRDFRKAHRDMEADMAKLGAATIDQIAPLSNVASVGLLNVAREEISGCSDVANARAVEAMTERLSIRMAATEADAIQSMRSGFSVLASIGATAPFVGLFGTVWGIMNSFIGISQAQTTNLAVVAPGIAEALRATALGLVSAIPAVLVYNVLSRRMAGFRRHLHHVSVMLACHVSHETERTQASRLKLAM